MQWRGPLIRGLGSVGSRSIGPGTLGRWWLDCFGRQEVVAPALGGKPRPCNQYLGVL
jgi:hypothetical protein